MSRIEDWSDIDGARPFPPSGGPAHHGAAGAPGKVSLVARVYGVLCILDGIVKVPFLSLIHI